MEIVDSISKAIHDEFCDIEPILAEFSSDPQPSCTSIHPLNYQAARECEKSYMTASQLPEIIRANLSSSSSSSSQLISFGNVDLKQTEKPLHGILPTDAPVMPLKTINFSSSSILGKNHQLYGAADELWAKRVCTVTRTPLQAKDHVVAERKRRQKLGQLFISLSKVVPGIKKLDKATLLGDAAKQVKELQERVKVLEEAYKKPTINNYDMASSSSSFSESSIGGSTKDSVVAEIKVRILDKSVLIKVFYKKQIKGLISKIQREMEKLHLNILDIRAMPFGTSSVDITILSEMENEFCGTVKDIVDQLQKAFPA